MDATLAFYGKLGFSVTGRHPEEGTPTWAEIRRDEVVLWFYTEPPRGTPGSPILSGTLYLFPESVDDLAEELSGRVEFTWGPETMEYGMREFAVRDPDGYFIAFTGPA
jgi:hypothetical protein